MIRIRLIALLLMILPFATVNLSAQVVLTLDKTIKLATDSSLQSFIAKNEYLASYWEYRSYKAGRLPSLTLNLTPASYTQSFIEVFNFETEKSEYRRQQSYYARGGLTLSQNLDALGGSFYVNSNLDYLRNFGKGANNNFTSVPFRIGYTQKLLGYNSFKWEKKIEPLKFEKAKKELIYNMETISENVTTLFFELAMNQVRYDIAVANVSSTDTLYLAAQERQKIAAITQGDLLTLRLDALNAKNEVQNAEIKLKRAMFQLASYLNLDKNTEIKLILPSRPRDMDITIEKALLYAHQNNPSFLDIKQNVLEKEQLLDETRKKSLFEANFSASVGFNQVGESFSAVYSHLLRQDLVSVSLSIPILDWGVRKGRYNMAKNNLNIARIKARQTENTIEEDVIITVSDFNKQQDLINSAEEAVELALMAYKQAKQRFMIGKADINTLTLAFERQQTAQTNHITALEEYWKSYFKIRKLTLFDFDMGLPLSAIFDYENGF